MSVFPVKLPDVGEGVAEAELIAWHVAVGDHVTPESVLAEVMTDKATVEISSPVSGTITFLHGEPGEVLAVGTEFVGVELDGGAPPTLPAPTVEPAPAAAEPEAEQEPVATPASTAAPERPDGPRALASPAVRHRARQLGIDLAAVTGTGPDGRVVHADLDRHLLGGHSVRAAAADEARIERVRGLRRRIAERLSSSWSEIPHITYVEAVDATELEVLRAELNRSAAEQGVRLTILPFLVRAIVVACRDQPRFNARYDAANQALAVHDAVHVGIATQTDDGLVVPVLRHAESRSVWQIAAEIGRLAEAARHNRATPQELSGSTITITSLGALGGLMTTPIINQPEVAIVGVNKLETRPVWRDGVFVPRQMMNLSSSFDHRIIDGWDAARFVQRLKTLLEVPALLFTTDGG